jgi:DNA-binding NarL/FixJ family response regulator
MKNERERKRVLIGTGAENQSMFRDLFRRDPLDRWVTLEAESFSRARFVLQHEPCDVLVVNDDLYQREGGQGLAWLAWQREVPVVLLVGQSPETYARAYQLGVSVCLPRDQVMGHPTVLEAGLGQAMNICEMRFGYQRIKEQLAQSRRHTDCLVNMLWRATPRSSDNHWFPQRYMMERLSEELARTERHTIPLTMVLGQMQPNEAGEEAVLPDWVANTIVTSKRRCDVAGQYGTNGFLLLLVQTTKQGGIDCCRRLRKTIEHSAGTTQPPHLIPYFGVVGPGPGKTTPQALLRCAEEKLEAARANPDDPIAAD